MPISCRAVAASALTFLLIGCAHNNTQSYADAVLNRPMPADDDSRMRECTWIRSEIARQQGLAGVGATMATTPLMAAAYQAMAQRNIAALEARAANVQCTAAFSNTPAAAPATKQSFDQCFAPVSNIPIARKTSASTPATSDPWGQSICGDRSMTTYAYRIILNDSELIAVQAALEHYRKVCESELSAGPRAPYWAHARAIDAVLGRLFADAQMTSTSSFCWPKDAG